MKRLFLLVLLLSCFQGAPGEQVQQVIHVGPTRAVTLPSQAARLATDGSLILIDAGIYLNDVAVWPQNDLYILGVGGRVQLMAGGRSAANKAIWVMSGDRVRVEGVDFSGARSTHLNGAGIRYEGMQLSLVECRFYGNQMGLLTANREDSRIFIERSEFHSNTVDHQRYGRLGHNIYIGRAERFVLRDSHVYNANTGHLVKTRARRNLILYNRLTDEFGASSYLLDIAEGGEALVMGNLLHKSAGADNQAAISFAAESNRRRTGQTLQVIHNTLVADLAQALLVHNHSATKALVANNLLQGDALPLLGAGRQLSNLVVADAGLAAASRMDFRLADESPAIDAAQPRIISARGEHLIPERQYRHPAGSIPRNSLGPPDIGAYEWTGP